MQTTHALACADGSRPVAQGDVLLVPYHGPLPTDALREDVDPHHGVVLAYGEVTGSAHALDPGTAHILAPTATTPRLLVVDVLEAATAIVRHLKHPPIGLPPKTVRPFWRIVGQVEEVEGVGVRVGD